MEDNVSFVRRLSQFGTWLHTRLSGIEVGKDAMGNRYYRAKKTVAGVREQRWVVYAGEPEASKVPPEWHIWLHHLAAVPLPADSKFHQRWQQPHEQNFTGTEAAFLPPGHMLEGGQRKKATGDYHAWRPEQ